MRVAILILILFALHGTSAAQPAPAREVFADSVVAAAPSESGARAEDPPAAAGAHETEPAEEISTELGGVDSLGVMPTEIVTRVAGGTRRVSLESTVFRREDPFEYTAGGRRDPFRALLVDEKKEGEIETDLLRLDGATLRGVVWSDGQYLALVSDKNGKSFVLREGDPIYQGRVRMVTQSQATFDVSDFGDYQQITLKVRGEP